MAANIDLGALNDRDLLVLAVRGVNEANEHLKTLNGRVAEHDAAVLRLQEWQRTLAGPEGLCVQHAKAVSRYERLIAVGSAALKIAGIVVAGLGLPVAVYALTH